MSSFTQFTGSAVPFGQLVPLWDSRSNPTVDGIEYLKTGALKSSTGYSSLVSNFPSLGWNVQTGSAYSYVCFDNQTHFYLTDGTRYYVFNSSGTGSYGTSVTSTWTAPLSGSAAVNDAYRLGTSSTLIGVGTTATTNFYTAGTSAVVISTTTTIMRVGASNTAGTLAVMAATAGEVANAIWTSTNGTSWTSRTPTGGATISISRAMFSPVGNCFVYMIANGTVYTATDGFTLTSRGIPTGLPAGTIGTNIGNTNFCASSASSTLFAVGQSNVGYIVKTTNGTSYTATAVSTLFPGVSAAVVPKIVYMNGAYYAIIGYTCNYPSSALYKSVDEGATWTAVASPFITPYAASNGSYYFIDAVNVLNGNIIATSRISGSATGFYGVLSSYDAANFIGIPVATYQQSGISSLFNAPNDYVRIK